MPHNAEMARTRHPGRTINYEGGKVKTIVCYGDSNTWGANPSSPDRFDHDVRWTAVLARELGAGYRVVEEGLNGRTTVVDDINEPNRNGYKQLIPVLESQQPVDLVIIMLGTNDLKARHNRSAADIGQSVSLLANTARSTLFGPKESRPKVLILCPPPIATLTDLDGMFAGALEKSLELPRYYELAARWSESDYLNTGDYIRSSDADGIHFDQDQLEPLGKAVAAKVKEIFKQ
jgi:lysophospholipase L1-like esterase